MGKSDYSDRKHKLSEYMQIMEAYLDNQIDAATFEYQYLKTFKNDATLWQELEYETLNGLFSDIDAFCADALIRDQDDLDEPELKARTVKALQRLKSF